MTKTVVPLQHAEVSLNPSNSTATFVQETIMQHVQLWTK